MAKDLNYGAGEFLRARYRARRPNKLPFTVIMLPMTLIVTNAGAERGIPVPSENGEDTNVALD